MSVIPKTLGDVATIYRYQPSATPVVSGTTWYDTPKDGDIVRPWFAREAVNLFHPTRRYDGQGKSLMVIRPHGEVPAEVLLVYLNSTHAQRWIVQHSDHRNVITTPLLRQLPVPVLTEPERAETLLKLCRHVERVKKLQEESRRTLNELLESIVHHWMIKPCELTPTQPPKQGE